MHIWGISHNLVILRVWSHEHILVLQLPYFVWTLNHMALNLGWGSALNHGETVEGLSQYRPTVWAMAAILPRGNLTIHDCLGNHRHGSPSVLLIHLLRCQKTAEVHHPGCQPPSSSSPHAPALGAVLPLHHCNNHPLRRQILPPGH